MPSNHTGSRILRVIPQVTAVSQAALNHGGARAASVSGQEIGGELKGGRGLGREFEDSTPPTGSLCHTPLGMCEQVRCITPEQREREREKYYDTE
jgi:hypothetical protein